MLSVPLILVSSESTASLVISYIQIAFSTWRPAQLVTSTTYSFPCKNSWHNSLSLWQPFTLILSHSSRKAVLQSSSSWHQYTPSEPPLIAGFTMIGHAPHVFCQAMHSS